MGRTSYHEENKLSWGEQVIVARTSMITCSPHDNLFSPR
jgi:hypothetical protein